MSRTADFDMDFTGDKLLMKQLESLSKKGGKNAIRAAVRRGQTILKQGIRSAIPTHAKSIRKAVGSKFNAYKGVAKVGLNIGKKKGKGYAPHAALYVLGSGDRYHKDGSYAGKMPANPVVKKGIAASEAKAVSEMRIKLDERIKKETGKI